MNVNNSQKSIKEHRDNITKIPGKKLTPATLATWEAEIKRIIV
jgi:hypothetical protein